MYIYSLRPLENFELVRAFFSSREARGLFTLSRDRADPVSYFTDPACRRGETGIDQRVNSSDFEAKKPRSLKQWARKKTWEKKQAPRRSRGRKEYMPHLIQFLPIPMQSARTPQTGPRSVDIDTCQSFFRVSIVISEMAVYRRWIATTRRDCTVSTTTSTET